MKSVFRPLDAVDSPAAAALRNSRATEVKVTYNLSGWIHVTTDDAHSTGLRFSLNSLWHRWIVAGTPFADIEFTLFKDVDVVARLDYLDPDNCPTTTAVDAQILLLMPTITTLELLGVAEDALEDVIRYLAPEYEDEEPCCTALRKINIFRAVEELNKHEGVIDAIEELLESTRTYHEEYGSGNAPELTVWSRGRSQFDEAKGLFISAGEDTPCPCEVSARSLLLLEDWL